MKIVSLTLSLLPLQDVLWNFNSLWDVVLIFFELLNQFFCLCSLPLQLQELIIFTTLQNGHPKRYCAHIFLHTLMLPSLCLTLFSVTWTYFLAHFDTSIFVLNTFSVTCSIIAFHSGWVEQVPWSTCFAGASQKIGPRHFGYKVINLEHFVLLVNVHIAVEPF